MSAPSRKNLPRELHGMVSKELPPRAMAAVRLPGHRSNDSFGHEERNPQPNMRPSWMDLPIELRGMIIEKLPLGAFAASRLVACNFNGLSDEASLITLEHSLAGLQERRPYDLNKLHTYSSRWNGFDGSKPVEVNALMRPREQTFHVIKGYFISVELLKDGFKYRFNILPSSLRPEPLPRPTKFTVGGLAWNNPDTSLEPIAYGWDICARLQVLAVATPNDQDQKSFKVQFFQMSNGHKYRDDLLVGAVCGGGNAVNEVDLLLTSRRVAIRVTTLQGMKIFVWNLQSGHRYLESHLHEVSSVCFIDEYRLLCVVQRTLVLWDFVEEGKHHPVTFELEQPDIIPTNILRSYELDDTQKHFCADPWEGIVVVDVMGYDGFDALVIPVSTLSVEKVRWEDWGHFAMKLKKIPGSEFFVFHTHVLFVTTIPGAVARSYVYDFSRYSRRAAEGDINQCLCDSTEVAPAIFNSRPWPQPLAVKRCGTFPLTDSSYCLPAENGIVVVTLQKNGHTGTAMWHQVQMTEQ